MLERKAQIPILCEFVKKIYKVKARERGGYSPGVVNATEDGHEEERKEERNRGFAVGSVNAQVSARTWDRDRVK